MSLEEELAELSVIYHGLINENVELEERYKRLEALLKEYADVVEDYLEHNFLHLGFDELEALQQRAKALGIEGEAS